MSRNRKGDQFILAAGIRAFYDTRRGLQPLLVRVIDVFEDRGLALVREADKVDEGRFTVPIHSLMPPLRVYGKRGRAWTTMHRPFYWRVVDTMRDYAERGIMSIDGHLSKRKAKREGDAEATAHIDAVLSEPVEQEAA